MPASNKPSSNKLADSLAVRERLQAAGLIAIPSSALSRTHRQRLLQTGFLREVMKGWYVAATPAQTDGGLASWVADFWTFVAGYLERRFGDAWCLGPEHSLALHAGDRAVPRRLIVRAARGGNKPLALSHGTELLDLRLQPPGGTDVERREGLRLVALPAALVGCAPGFFAAQPIAARTALGLASDAREVTRLLLAGGHSVVAGRLAGAFRNVGRDREADHILAALRGAGFIVNERDPFGAGLPVRVGRHGGSAEALRLRVTWAQFRQDIIANFPPSPGPVADPASYLAAVDAGYAVDAFHSLALEGYRVTPGLIEAVRDARAPDANATDARAPDARAPDARAPDAGAPRAAAPRPATREMLAAQGYGTGFRAVLQAVGQVLAGGDPTAVLGEHLTAWYRALFAPRLAAGMLEGVGGEGYRHGRGVSRYSRHIPPPAALVGELMGTYFELLREEADCGVRVVMGHCALLDIQPFIDGNGPLARWVMNLFRAAGGHSWLVIPLSRRVDYRAALERAHVDGEIVPLARFLAGDEARPDEARPDVST